MCVFSLDRGIIARQCAHIMEGSLRTVFLDLVFIIPFAFLPQRGRWRGSSRMRPSSACPGPKRSDGQSGSEWTPSLPLPLPPTPPQPGDAPARPSPALAQPLGSRRARPPGVLLPPEGGRRGG